MAAAGMAWLWVPQRLSHRAVLLPMAAPLPQIDHWLEYTFPTVRPGLAQHLTLKSSLPACLKGLAPASGHALCTAAVWLTPCCYFDTAATAAAEGEGHPRQRQLPALPWPDPGDPRLLPVQLCTPQPHLLAVLSFGLHWSAAPAGLACCLVHLPARLTACSPKLPGQPCTLPADLPACLPRLRPALLPSLSAQQKWFLLEFLGDDSEIDISCQSSGGGQGAPHGHHQQQHHHHHPEFSEFSWQPLEALPGGVVDFKQGVYRQVARHFAPEIARRVAALQVR